MTILDINQLKIKNETRWANAKVTRDFSSIAKRLVAAKNRYKTVESATGVPWFVIAVIHMRESSQDWSRSLAQGDPWNKVSVHVPAGRGPFASWEAAAKDALVDCPPHLASKKDWGLAATLVNLELYNGAGYAKMGKPSPYLWAGTNQYVSGKYVADGTYDPSHIDAQPGCAGMILAMMEIDKTIKFPAAKNTPAVKAVTGGGAIVAATVAVGTHQGWGTVLWIIIGCAMIALAIAAFLFIRKK